MGRTEPFLRRSLSAGVRRWPGRGPVQSVPESCPESSTRSPGKGVQAVRGGAGRQAGVQREDCSIRGCSLTICRHWPLCCDWSFSFFLICRAVREGQNGVLGQSDREHVGIKRDRNIKCQYSQKTGFLCFIQYTGQRLHCLVRVHSSGKHLKPDVLC